MPNFTSRKRRPRIANNNPNNPNYVLLREKLARKRANRQQKRIEGGKPPVAFPLTMVDGVQQRRAYGEGKLLLLDGNKQVRIPLVSTKDGGEKAYLQGVYKLPSDRLAILRSTLFFGTPILKYYVRVNGGEKYVSSFFFRTEDIAHVFLEDKVLKGRGLGVRAASKAEKEYRALGGSQPVWVDPKLTKLYEKLHYWKTGGKFPENMEKVGKAYARDNMRKNHVIEAIDPVTGKQKTFTFHIKNGGV